MYDDFILEIARRYPAGSLLDVACNNGYFPVRAELAGMRRCAGIDLGRHYRYAVRFLNDVVGTKVKFMHGRYDPRARSITPPAATADFLSPSPIVSPQCGCGGCQPPCGHRVPSMAPLTTAWPSPSG